MLRQVRWRSHQHRGTRRQHPANQRGVGLGTDADGQVDARLHQIEHAIAGLQIDLDVRVQLQKIGQGRSQLRIGERHAARHPQLAAQGTVLAAGFLLHVLHQGQHLLAAAQTAFTRIGERDAAGGALKKPSAQPLL